MGSGFFWSVGMGIPIVAAGVYYYGDRVLPPEVAEAVVPEVIAQPAEPTEPAVLVVVVESSAHLELLRAKLIRHGLRASTSRAFAVRDAVFAADLESASGPLNSLGWASRPLTIVSRDRRAAAPAGGGEGRTATDRSPGRGGNLIADLAKKDRLTQADARALLEHLDDPLPYGRR